MVTATSGRGGRSIWAGLANCGCGAASTGFTRAGSTGGISGSGRSSSSSAGLLSGLVESAPVTISLVSAASADCGPADGRRSSVTSAGAGMSSFCGPVSLFRMTRAGCSGSGTPMSPVASWAVAEARSSERPSVVAETVSARRRRRIDNFPGPWPIHADNCATRPASTRCRPATAADIRPLQPVPFGSQTVFRSGPIRRRRRRRRRPRPRSARNP